MLADLRWHGYASRPYRLHSPGLRAIMIFWKPVFRAIVVSTVVAPKRQVKIEPALLALQATRLPEIKCILLTFNLGTQQLYRVGNCRNVLLAVRSLGSSSNANSVGTSIAQIIMMNIWRGSGDMRDSPKTKEHCGVKDARALHSI